MVFTREYQERGLKLADLAKQGKYRSTKKQLEEDRRLEADRLENERIDMEEISLERLIEIESDIPNLLPIEEEQKPKKKSLFDF